MSLWPPAASDVLRLGATLRRRARPVPSTPRKPGWAAVLDSHGAFSCNAQCSCLPVRACGWRVAPWTRPNCAIGFRLLADGVRSPINEWMPCHKAARRCRQRSTLGRRRRCSHRGAGAAALCEVLDHVLLITILVYLLLVLFWVLCGPHEAMLALRSNVRLRCACSGLDRV